MIHPKILVLLRRLRWKANDPVDNIFESCYNLTEIVNAVINLRSVRSGFYRRTE